MKIKKRFSLARLSRFYNLEPRTFWGATFVFIVVFSLLVLNLGLRPVKIKAEMEVFYVTAGESFDTIINRLHEEGLIRSPLAMKALGLLTGSANKLQPGRYELESSFSGSTILRRIASGISNDVVVNIPEGLTIFEVDQILSSEKIIQSGTLITYKSDDSLEGRLFPDTYKFSVNSKINDVVEVFLRNFKEKAEPILDRDPKNFEINLIVASLIQEEVPGEDDQKIVSGIMKKRVQTGMPLQVDATACYMKRLLEDRYKKCHPVTPLDLKIDSPYNTYLNKGWPPGPIASPGVSAISAALEPKASPYWFYLSDPITHKTIFSKTLEEHNQNINIYLR
jgi:UPF0755 protein